MALPATPEPVLLGAAMLGAVAGGAFASLRDAMQAMSRLGPVTRATAPAMTRFHSAKRRVHALMRQFEKESRTAMQAHGACLPAATEDTAQCC